MNHTWYVTYEVPTDGTLLKRRHPRLTQTFETEAAAKDFARTKFNERLYVPNVGKCKTNHRRDPIRLFGRGVRRAG